MRVVIAKARDLAGYWNVRPESQKDRATWVGVTGRKDNRKMDTAGFETGRRTGLRSRRGTTPNTSHKRGNARPGLSEGREKGQDGWTIPSKKSRATREKGRGCDRDARKPEHTRPQKKRQALQTVEGEKHARGTTNPSARNEVEEQSPEGIGSPRSSTQSYRKKTTKEVVVRRRDEAKSRGGEWPGFAGEDRVGCRV